MKLKDNFLIHQTGEQTHLVDVSGAFNGLVTGNATTAFILQQLTKDTTEAEVLAALKQEYDGPEELMARDVHKIVEKLQSIGALES
ncbi:MAG: PqqD family protein [Acetatifactor sp.]|nr:PqqD family protein [Acetatifactor sp.]